MTSLSTILDDPLYKVIVYSPGWSAVWRHCLQFMMIRCMKSLSTIMDDPLYEVIVYSPGWSEVWSHCLQFMMIRCMTLSTVLDDPLYEVIFYSPGWSAVWSHCLQSWMSHCLKSLFPLIAFYLYNYKLELKFQKIVYTVPVHIYFFILPLHALSNSLATKLWRFSAKNVHLQVI
jgi:hypothetical protein